MNDLTKKCALDYAMSVLNIEFDNSELHIVWNSEFGPAYCDLLTRNPSTNAPIYDLLYRTIKHNFFDSEGNLINDYRNQHEVLLQKLIDMINDIDFETLVFPSAKNVYNFKTLDGKTNLPFILNGLDYLKEPLSLISTDLSH